MSSIIRQVFHRLMRPSYLVGRDLEGNKYYEYPNANNGRPKRTVQYKQSDDMWSYVANGKRLPVQWSAWLTHTRPNPPSIEELTKDLARQRRVQMNAATLEAHDKEERERMSRPSQTFNFQVQEPLTETKTEQQRTKSPSSVPSVNGTVPVRDPWAEAKKGSDEPQPWSPVVTRRG